MLDVKEIDLRSDTITKPTKEMLEFMLTAEVGDDVYGEDPTVKELERYACQLFGKEAALYFPTGTMGNLCAILAHCWNRGSEIILGDQSHVHLFEQGNISQFGNIHARTVKNLPDGTFCLDELRNKVRSHGDYLMSSLYPSTALICIENTHNMCYGSVLPLSFIRSVKQIADENNLKLHLDGARCLNAAVQLGVSPATIVKDVDSVSVCLSKGLCSPIGTVVLGDHEFIKRVYRIRKGLGGGMRQIGYMAACGLFSLKFMVNRLADDHKRALQIAVAINTIGSKCFTVDLDYVKTNIVYINCKHVEPTDLIKRLRKITDDERLALKNEVCIVKMIGFGTNRVRFLTSQVVNDESTRLAILKLIFVMNEIDREINPNFILTN